MTLLEEREKFVTNVMANCLYTKDTEEWEKARTLLVLVFDTGVGFTFATLFDSIKEIAKATDGKKVEAMYCGEMQRAQHLTGVAGGLMLTLKLMAKLDYTDEDPPELEPGPDLKIEG